MDVASHHLLPCPSRDGTHIQEAGRAGYPDCKGKSLTYIVCRDCGLRGPLSEGFEPARKAWNNLPRRLAVAATLVLLQPPDAA